MSKPSRRSGREARKERYRAQKELRKQQREEGLEVPPQRSPPNRKSELTSEEAEQAERQWAVIQQVLTMRALMPPLLENLGGIPDPRDPKKTKHKLTLLLIYGILMFVYHMASRRQANEKMTRPVFMSNLNLLFPELEELPHHDTLNRLLSRIDVGQIQSAHIDLIRRLIRNKKFRHLLVDGCLPVAIDGTQKFTRSSCWSEECQQREIKKTDGTETQYYVYVLEASLAFCNGMVIPLMSEFLSYTEGDRGTSKQDCELKAFKRLAKRLKKEFPGRRIMVLLDGLYPNGPIIRQCREHSWQFMMVLKDGCLPSVWEEFNGLRTLERENKHTMAWGDRWQRFSWVNQIVYYHGSSGRKKETLHVVVCEESWREIDKDGCEVTKRSRHAWISSKQLSCRNVHERCNLGARHRWGIETNILVEKRHGYSYEHCFSYDWNAMKGYHYLMRLAHMLNTLAQFSQRLVALVRRLTVRGSIEFLRETIAGPWLIAEEVRAQLARPAQLRLA